MMTAGLGTGPLAMVRRSLPWLLLPGPSRSDWELQTTQAVGTWGQGAVEAIRALTFMQGRDTSQVSERRVPGLIPCQHT